MQTFEQAVDKTVNWWAAESFGGKLNQDNGDDSPNGGIGFALMNILSLQAQKTVTNEQIEKFKSSLRDNLITSEHFRRCGYLSVDYHPDKELSDAYASAGINSSCAPIKTTTWIYGEENKVIVSLGYRGDRVEI